MDKTSLGDRMKTNYESVSQTRLTRRTPVIIRLDGKAFHTFTKGMKRPFDENLIQCMTTTTRNLVENIEGCEFGYTQSDEISLLLTDYKKFKTQAWFDYKVQKIVSVAASMCTAYFNRIFFKNYGFGKPAFFDARVFSIPKEEVVNYFIWRQQDATRNSIQMVGQSVFSHKELHGKSCDEIQEMLWSQKGINWNDIDTEKKMGSCVYKRYFVSEMKQTSINVVDNKAVSVGYDYDGTIRTEYYIDKEPPIFTKDRDYIQKFVDVDKE